MKVPYSKMLGTSFALSLLGLSASAQTGIGTITPRTMLDVNGAISVAETSSPALTGANPAYIIPANVSQVQLVASATAPTGTIALTTTSPVAGQKLAIYNNTTLSATLNGEVIAATRSVEFVYSAGGWRSIANAAGYLNGANLYTIDGSITGDRTVTLAGHTVNYLGSGGNFQFNATGNTFSTSANQLLMTQTGDQFGSSTIALRNRPVQAGLLVTTANQTTGKSQIAVTDLFMETQNNVAGYGYKPKQMNVRLESRAGATIVGPYGGTADSLEIQIGKTVGVLNGPGLVVGSAYAIAPLYFGVNSSSYGIGSRMTISPASVESKITLYDGGTNPQAGAAISTTHYGFGITNNQLNYDVMNGASHVFYNNSKNGSGTELMRVNTAGVTTNNSYYLNGRPEAGVDGGRFYHSGPANIYDTRSGASGTGTSGAHVFRGDATTGSTTLMYVNFAGNAYANSFNNTSDARLKSEVKTIGYGLSTVMSIQPKQYQQLMTLEMKDGKPVAHGAETKHTIGFLAQELYKLVPEAVSKPTDEANQVWAVDYTKLVPVLTKAIQEQQAEIVALKAELAGKATASTMNEMQAALQSLRAEVQTLKAGAGTASAK